MAERPLNPTWTRWSQGTESQSRNLLWVLIQNTNFASSRKKVSESAVMREVGMGSD